ncbi:hypothetical protein UU7_17022 [Rhodanobacter spathiphylli B39]|uniref:Uncharacterized protein n=1 Tax=Rhodanobacter spathiphylli B39 TaxID=1163407 RepID=I4VPF8_9GAMM|nr:hypothetical protein UU7_17022 [Rhodanobacter spathiphylli B39]
MVDRCKAFYNGCQNLAEIESLTIEGAARRQTLHDWRCHDVSAEAQLQQIVVRACDASNAEKITFANKLHMNLTLELSGGVAVRLERLVRADHTNPAV